MRRLLVLAVLLFALPAGAVIIDWVEIGDPGNAADPDTNTELCGALRDQPCGAVASPYRISKYEVTNAQYAKLLNAKAASDPLALYSESMGSDPSFGGITRSALASSTAFRSGMAARNTWPA